jgi:hypothetical protein
MNILHLHCTLILPRKTDKKAREIPQESPREEQPPENFPDYLSIISPRKEKKQKANRITQSGI